VRLAAGDGTLERVAASRQSRRLATLACVAGAAAAPCTAKDVRAIAVWRLADDLRGLTPIFSLDTRDFDGAVPSRIALSPDGHRLVVAFESARRLLLVSVADGGVTKIPIDSGLLAVREIAFSHDGRVFGAGGEAPQPEAGTGVDRVRLWNVGASGLEATQHPTLTLSPSANKVYDLAFAADRQGRLLVLAGGESGAIDRWDVGSGRMLDTLDVDSWPIYLMAYSARGSLFAAVDKQNVVRLWDTSSWIPLQLTPPTDRFERPGLLTFVGDGAWLASGASTLQVWDLGLGSLRLKLCALLRAPGQHGADSPVPLWHPDDLCSTR
jgi:WD40 repeat protein